MNTMHQITPYYGAAISTSPVETQRASQRNFQTGRDFVASGDLEIAPPFHTRNINPSSDAK